MLSECVVLSVSVEGAMVSDDVLSDVFLSGTTTASSSTAASPAWSRSFCYPCQRLPFFDGEKFLCRQDRPGSEKTFKHLGFESNCGCVARRVS